MRWAPEGGIKLEAAVLAASGKSASNVRVKAAINGIMSVKGWLDDRGVFKTIGRLAAFVGQCAHESAGFNRSTEALWYSAKRLTEVWPHRYPTLAIASRYAGNPEKLANHTYGNRLGNRNEASGDGWTFRGRGWIQLTGRSNYLIRGRALGLNLIDNPNLANKPGYRWMIAASFMGNTSLNGKTAFQWADLGLTDIVTKIINGGYHGLEDRRARTMRAWEALA